MDKKAKFPFVSIIVSCRNEEKFIDKCLDSIIALDYPRDRLEVLLIDGMSEDGTREIAKKYIQEYPCIRLLDNQRKIVPCAWNIGIKNAQGEILTIMSAHASYEKHYISKCVKYLKEYNPDNVGGIWKIVPRENTLVGKSIAVAESHPFGVGNSYLRIGSKKPRWVDAVAFGCYRKAIFEKIGLFNENIARSEDMDFNIRLRNAGGKILLVPDMVIYYYARSDFNSFCKHNFNDGFWAIYPTKFAGRIVVSLRHLVPFVFVSSLIGIAVLSFFFTALLWLFLSIIGFYALANFYSSCRIAIQEKNLRYLFIMPLIFAMLHIGYGLGSIWGLLGVAISGRFWLTTYNHCRCLAFKGASH